MKGRERTSPKEQAAVSVVTVSEQSLADEAPLSATKEQVLKKTQLKRNIWVSVEVFLLLALVALLVLHSFRLDKNKSDNAYAVWSSSWVMVLLSILLVIVALATFITFYYFRTALAWIRDPSTTDEAVLSPTLRELNKVQWGVIRSKLSSPQRHRQEQQEQRRHRQQVPPWISQQGRNSKAWRQTRAQQYRQRQGMHQSSLSSSLTASSIPQRGSGKEPKEPKRPSPALGRHK
ncbi:hypothetical protein GGI12_000468 [Dipsacomyces acuminosporus]|nr:hypothetical protein GGI12_000468 [Dipsacomyces acuminosporus]